MEKQRTQKSKGGAGEKIENSETVKLVDLMLHQQSQQTSQPRGDTYYTPTIYMHAHTHYKSKKVNPTCLPSTGSKKKWRQTTNKGMIS